MIRKDKIKVVVGKIGLDDHWRGIITISDALQKAGMEVVYLGIGQRVDGFIESLLQEDADVAGLSFLCGSHLEIMRRFMNRLRERKLNHILVIIGGIIPLEDIKTLKELGVAEVFLPGTPLQRIVDFIAENLPPRMKLSDT
ncbi:MAG: cobalamin-dependent protein [Pseudomonadota bacterium]